MFHNITLKEATREIKNYIQKLQKYYQAMEKTHKPTNSNIKFIWVMLTKYYGDNKFTNEYIGKKFNLKKGQIPLLGIPVVKHVICSL